MHTIQIIAELITNASADLHACRITEEQHMRLTDALWERAEALGIATGVMQVIARAALAAALEEMAARGAV